MMVKIARKAGLFIVAFSGFGASGGARKWSYWVQKIAPHTCSHATKSPDKMPGDNQRKMDRNENELKKERKIPFQRNYKSDWN